MMSQSLETAKNFEKITETQERTEVERNFTSSKIADM